MVSNDSSGDRSGSGSRSGICRSISDSSPINAVHQRLMKINVMEVEASACLIID